MAATQSHIDAVRAHLGPLIKSGLSVGLHTHGALSLPADHMLIEEKVTSDGMRIWQTVPLGTFAEMFGALFAAGKPTRAALKTACDTPACRGYCRYADEWSKAGLINA